LPVPCCEHRPVNATDLGWWYLASNTNESFTAPFLSYSSGLRVRSGDAEGRQHRPAGGSTLRRKRPTALFDHEAPRGRGGHEGRGRLATPEGGGMTQLRVHAARSEPLNDGPPKTGTINRGVTTSLIVSTAASEVGR
jgi:hypothetical protein